jgi:hypothetical protein
MGNMGAIFSSILAKIWNRISHKKISGKIINLPTFVNPEIET